MRKTTDPRLIPPPAPFVVATPAIRFRCPVRGDCMEPEIDDGDHVVIDPALTPCDGDYVIFELVGHGLLIKQYREEAEGAVLVALNGDIRYPVDARVRIVGVATAVWRNMAHDIAHWERGQAERPTRAARRNERRPTERTAPARRASRGGVR